MPGSTKEEDCGKSPTEMMKGMADTVSQLTKLKGITDSVVETTVKNPTIKAKMKRDSVEMAVQKEYDRMEKSQLSADETAERTYCERQRAQTIATFPTIALDGDDSDGMTCLTTNRDMIVDAFCNFRATFDDTLRSHGLFKKDERSGKAFWPRICCANEGDCKDHPATIKQTDMRPFVMAQGGTPTKEAMRGEIFDLLGHHAKGDSRVDGLIVAGMLHAIEGVKSRVDETAASTLRKEMQGVFASMNLCGPRVMALPGKETRSLCELFYSYPHMMKSFQEQFKAMLHAVAGRRRRLLAWKRSFSGRAVALRRAFPSGRGSMMRT
jgi:hypothetical protein